MLKIFKNIYEKFYIIKNGKELLFMDKLTGAYNRNWYEYHVKLIENKDFDLVLIDLNGFKQINDTYGHDVGDEALIIVANLLQAIFHNKEDYTVRWGGDEFIVITPKSHGLDILHELTANYISYGVAHHNIGDDISATFKEADNKLYDMKKDFHKN